jgi:hypothetical protein
MVVPPPHHTPEREAMDMSFKYYEDQTVYSKLLGVSCTVQAIISEGANPRYQLFIPEYGTFVTADECAICADPIHAAHATFIRTLLTQIDRMADDLTELYAIGVLNEWNHEHVRDDITAARDNLIRKSFRPLTGSD